MFPSASRFAVSTVGQAIDHSRQALAPFRGTNRHRVSFMALLDFFMGIQDPVVGSYRVTVGAKPSATSSVAKCDLVGELTAPGFAPRVLEHFSPLTSID